MWNKVQLGFDADEETVNFGSRQMAVFDKSVYETSTLAIITKDVENQNNSLQKEPRIHCTKYYGPNSGVAIVINETVIILNSEGTEIRSKFSYSAMIDSYVIKSDGSIIFVALKSGDVYCSLLHINEDPIFLKNICNANSENESTFSGIFLKDENEKYELILTSYNGNIYRLKDINLTELSRACASNLKDSINEITENMKFDYIHISEQEHEFSKILHSIELRGLNDYWMMYLVETRKGQELQVWSTDFNLIYSLPLEDDEEKYSLKKLLVCKNKSLIYGLTNKGTVLTICPYNVTILNHGSNIEWNNFENLNEENNNLLVLTKGPSTVLQLVKMPGFKSQFQMNVSSNCHIAKNQSSLDDLFYLEVLSNASEEISSIHLKMISESQPEYRLERMLKRGKFHEAEQFARAFNLKTELVHKSQLQTLSNDIQPWVTSNIPLKEAHALFKLLLEKIEDTEFVAKCALNAISSDFNLMVDVLKYAGNRIETQISNKETQNTVILQKLYRDVQNELLKLSTFFAISEKPLNVDNWLWFSKADLIEECQQFLKQGKLNEVMLIWNRHVLRMRNQLTFDQITFFFRGIPNSVPVTRILVWLRIFLPVAFSLYSKIISSLVNWCREKVNIMELLAEPEWIETGIQFLENILSMIRQDVKLRKSQNVIQSEYSSDSPVQALLFYKRILTEMSIMKNQYRIDISIRDYTQENQQEVIFSILDRVPLEELNSFVHGFLERLLARENINADTIISEYIQNLVESSVNWWYWGEAPWESRVDILLKCITGIPEKLTSVLTVLKYSPVPWSATITQICDENLKYDNPTTRLIFEQKRMVNCKLVLKKYDLKHSHLKLIQSNFGKVVLYIFQQKRNTMLEDTLSIAETFDPKLRIEVYKIYVQQLIESGDIEGASSFLDDSNLPANVIISCCESIILRTHSLSSMTTFMTSLDSYIKIIDTAYKKLVQVTIKTNNSPMISKYVRKQLKDVYYIKKNYISNATNWNFTNQKEKAELLKFCLNVVLIYVKENEANMKTISIKLNELANCLEYPLGQVYIQFIRLAMSENQFNVVAFVLRLLLNEDKFISNVSKEIINLAFYILSYSVQNPNCMCENNIATSMHCLVILALDSCPLDQIQKGVEAARWLQLLPNSSQLDSSHLLSDKEILHSYSKSIDSAKIMKLLRAYCVYLNVDLNWSNNYPASENFDSIKDFNEVQLIEVIKNIVEEENESIAFRIVIMLHLLSLHTYIKLGKEFNKCELVVQTHTLANACMNKLLQKLIGSRNLDTEFGSAVLFHFPRERAYKWLCDLIKSYKFDFQRLYALTELGLVYFQQIQHEEGWNKFYALRKQCTWGKQIIEFGISYKEAFKESQQEQKQLLLKLMQVPSISTTLLAKYCRDTRFEFQTCLKVYLKQTLVSWEPEFEIKVDPTTGEREIMVKNSDKRLLNKCREIISLIENRQELSQLISSSFWDSINYYYYEVYLILLTLMEENAMQPASGLFSSYRQVFLFLSSYQRIKKPQDHEKEQWYLLYQTTQPLPAISEYRLPFRLLFSRWTKSNSEPWKIITPELSIHTYTKWFTVLDALELDKNTLCTVAVHQMTSEQALTQRSDTEWCKHYRYQKLLADVRTCIENIGSLEMASASFYFVVNHLPPGADQVTAAKLCFLNAKNWLEVEKSDKAKAGYNKCQKKYLTISTTHILYVHELGKAQYLQLVLRPIELINSLYNDRVILEKNSGNVLIFPDINKAAEEISKLHKEDLLKIKLELLEEWLSPENFMVNVSLDGDDSLQDKFFAADHENFLRACYIVEGNVHTLGQHLANIALDRNADDLKPINVRLRALRCLFSTTTEDILEQVTGNTIDKLRNYMSILEFVSDLEALGLTYSLVSFTSCNKLEIVRSVLSLKNKKAVRLAARICLHFSVESTVAWNAILTKMCSAQMVEDLMNLLPNMPDNFCVLDVALLTRAWNMALISPLERASSKDHPELEKEVIKLVQACPIINKINIKGLEEICSRINLLDVINVLDSLKY